MRLALGQINPTVGDLSGNVSKMLDYAARALEGRAQVVIFPKLSSHGDRPRDLVEKLSFLARTEDALQDLAAKAPQGITIITGYVCSDGCWVFLGPSTLDVSGFC